MSLPSLLRNILVVTKRTRLQFEMSRLGLAHASELARHGFDIKRLRDADLAHSTSLNVILKELRHRKCNVHVEFAKSLKNIAPDIQLVITVGGDGTVLETAPHIQTSLPLLAVNSDPETSTGKLCSISMTKYHNFSQTMELLASGRHSILSRQRIVVDLCKSNQEELVRIPRLALNEVFYSEHDPNRPSKHELVVVPPSSDQPLAGAVQRSSGVIVATGSGSTAWIKSAGAVHPDNVERILRAADCPARGDVSKIAERLNEDFVFHPDDKRVLYLVRDPMLSYGGDGGGGGGGGDQREEVSLNQGFALSVSIRSMGFDSCLFFDGLFKYPVEYGSTAVLKVDPERPLKCICF